MAMNFISNYRKKAKLTQEALASIVGCTPGTISHYETGRRDPDSATIKLIIIALNDKGVDCAFEDLFPVKASAA